LTWFRRDQRIVWIDGGDKMLEISNQVVEEFLA
jgi:hypothetical protein